MPADDTTPLTAAGRAALEAELDALRRKRSEVVARIASTRSEGDLSENAGYHQAREDQARLEGRVATIEAQLRTAVIIDQGTSDGTVRLGSTVIVEDEFGQTEYTIVGPAEADPLAGRLSHLSPVGSALLGRRPGDQVAVQAPSGERTVTVTQVR
jgi:transcription elongation factor GreA